MHRAPLTAIEHDTELVESLRRPAAYTHPADDVDLIETHISWLLLAGEFAYKLKKPIVLDFLDFGTLERRRFYCEEEIRLNRRWAPEIYIDVVPVTISDGQARFGGDGEIVDYAVRMHRFDQALRLDRQLDEGRLVEDDMKALATTIADRHLEASQVPESSRTRVIELTAQFMRDNFPPLAGVVDSQLVDKLCTWTERELERRASLLAERFDDGFVRDCHGDLHLGNLLRLADGFRSFDCIEFSEDLRHIDVFCDLAFLVMDLAARRRLDLAAQLLNRYLEITGDYAGVPLLKLFYAYRCLVRAKVAVIRGGERDREADRAADFAEASFYCELAGREINQRVPRLVVMHGFSGSGKTFVASRLMAAMPAIRIRSDIERKRLADLAEEQGSGSAVGGGIYTAAATERVYARLRALARPILESGHNVVLDGTYLSAEERRLALEMAGSVGCRPVIVDVRAPPDVLRERIMLRGAADVSEARLDVLGYQLESAAPLSAAEQAYVVAFENHDSPNFDELLARVKQA
jgi:aminoglycoside phosphotransferase family enzyme/predicted kinase